MHDSEPAPISITAGRAAKALEIARRHTPVAAVPDDARALPDAFLAEQRDRQRAWRATAWTESVVPPVYGTPTLADVHTAGLPADIAAELVAWSKDPIRNLVLLGPVGTGKTHLAWSVLHDPYLAGRGVRGLALVDLLASLRPSDGPADTVGPRDVDLLLLDDIGAEKASDWTDQEVYALVHNRWEQQRPLVVTANLDPAGLRDALGARAYSRLKDGAVFLEIPGKDRRRSRG